MPNQIFSAAFTEIELVIGQMEKNGEGFAEKLRANQIPHLSFSQIKSIEFCERLYYLQYILNLELQPTPVYFVKGKLLHRLIAETYSKLQNDENIDSSVLQKFIDQTKLDFLHQNHIVNAANLHLKNLWEGYKIIGIEQPFVINIGDSLPPLVGIIDLLLMKEKELVIVDHKTGSNFYDKDMLQGAIYKWYASEKYLSDDVNFYYDNYRWVNNLDRIRKPALHREKVTIPKQNIEVAKDRIENGFNKIQKIKKIVENGRTANLRKNGECFRCQFKTICN